MFGFHHPKNIEVQIKSCNKYLTQAYLEHSLLFTISISFSFSMPGIVWATLFEPGIGAVAFAPQPGNDVSLRLFL